MSVAALAEKYNAFGILANDSDYLIYQVSLDVQIFSCQDLNINNLNTKSFDRKKLASHLGLTIEQLPLLATLVGNDLVLYNDPEASHFKQSLSKGERLSSHELIIQLAEFIKNNPNISLETLASKLFPKSDITDKAQLLKKSIDSYKLTDDVLEQPLGNLAEILESQPSVEWAELMAMKKYTQLFDLMNGCAQDLAIQFEDPSPSDPFLPLSRDLMKQIRQRTYGVLLYEKPGAWVNNEFVITVSEWFLEEELLKPILSRKAQNLHPGLRALWQSSKQKGELLIHACMYSLQ